MSLRKRAVVYTSFAAILGMAGFAAAQFRGPTSVPSPDRIFAYVDRNRDGTLDPDEIKRMPPAFREALIRARIPTDRPIEKEVFFKMAPRMIEEIRRGREQRGESTEESSEDSSRKTTESSRVSSSVSTSPHPAAQQQSFVTVKLPESYHDRDKNHDGQIGMYEWDRTKFSEFVRLDLNGDGFLTPRELTPKTPGTTTATTATAAVATPSRTTSTLSRSTAISPTSPSSSSPSSKAASIASTRDTRMAQFAFRSLDRNRDGSLSEEEWNRSRRTRESFQRAGVKLALPAKQDQFLAAYQQASAKEG